MNEQRKDLLALIRAAGKVSRFIIEIEHKTQGLSGLL